MVEKTKLLHVAVSCLDKEKTNLFFTTILGIPKIKSFSLPIDLSKEIFNILTSVDVEVFSNESSTFEVFYHGESNTNSFSHVCLELANKDRFFKKCSQYGLLPIIVDKNGKKLFFIRDFSRNLFELKFKS